jgi:hypothetical protein
LKKIKIKSLQNNDYNYNNSKAAGCLHSNQARQKKSGLKTKNIENKTKKQSYQTFSNIVFEVVWFTIFKLALECGSSAQNI